MKPLINESARCCKHQADDDPLESLADGAAGKLATSHSIAAPGGMQQRDLFDACVQLPCLLCGREDFGVPWLLVAILQSNRPPVIREVSARCAGDLRYAPANARTKMIEDCATRFAEEAA